MLSIQGDAAPLNPCQRGVHPLWNLGINPFRYLLWVSERIRAECPDGNYSVRQEIGETKFLELTKLPARACYYSIEIIFAFCLDYMGILFPYSLQREYLLLGYHPKYFKCPLWVFEIFNCGFPKGGFTLWQGVKGDGVPLINPDESKFSPERIKICQLKYI